MVPVDLRSIARGWGGSTNGKLMALAKQSFDIFVTVDQNLEHQQNLTKLRLGPVLVAVPDNNVKFFKPIFPDLLKAVESIGPGQVIHIVSPDFSLAAHTLNGEPFSEEQSGTAPTG